MKDRNRAVACAIGATKCETARVVIELRTCRASRLLIPTLGGFESRTPVFPTPRASRRVKPRRRSSKGLPAPEATEARAGMPGSALTRIRPALPFDELRAGQAGLPNGVTGREGRATTPISRNSCAINNDIIYRATGAGIACLAA